MQFKIGQIWRWPDGRGVRVLDKDEDILLFSFVKEPDSRITVRDINAAKALRLIEDVP